MVPETPPRIILLMGSLTYRGRPFVEAAGRLGLQVVKGLDLPRPLAEYWRPTLPLDFADPDRAARELIAFAKANPVRAILPVDDMGAVIAARACEELDLAYNSPEAAYAAKNKFVMRTRLAARGVPGPAFHLYHTRDDPAALAAQVRYPCVVKPILLSGSQGVIRADNPQEFEAAFCRTRSIVLGTGGEAAEDHQGHILVEDYIDGVEVALEALLAGGRLTPLALFDKPDPLVGPFFEETIYVTPSRLPPGAQDAILDCASRACAALGLREGPVHAELRLNEAGPWIVEVAGRSIGGLCSRVLRFGTADMPLEELILRQAVGLPLPSLERDAAQPDRRARGVMMIPIPAAGILRGVHGIEQAGQVEGIEEIEITLPLKHEAVPLPEGASYLGFIFARGREPAGVEATLRESHRRLRFEITPAIHLLT